MAHRPARVTLTTEGGYPFAAGGVSEWCDQLIRAIPDMDVDVISLTGARTPEPLYQVPSNVRSVRAVPLWAYVAPGRPPRGDVRSRFRDVYTDFLAAFLSPRAAPVDFAAALRGMFDYAQDEELAGALTSDDAVTMLADAWRAWPPGSDDPGVTDPVRPSLGDAALVTTWVEHMLRPLSEPVVDADVVHCASNGLAGLVGLAAAWTRGTPMVLSEHGVYLRERYLAYRDTSYGWPVKNALLRLTRAITQVVYAEADAIAPGNVYNRRWQLVGGADPDAIRTVYNGVDPARYGLAGPEPDEPTIVYVGRIDPLKDLVTLLRGFAIVRNEVPDARLRIFGVPAPTRQDYLTRCQQLLVDLGLEGSAAFEGRAPSAQQAYAAAQIVALTSVSEGFPYTVLEAMSSGRATVSTDVGGVREAVGDAGAVVPARDPAAFAAACVRLLRDPELRARSAAASRERVLSLFTLDRSMDEFRRIYAEVLANGRRQTTSRRLPRSVLVAP
jgi:glycosyltransferase involved in cell wall biosynthesis